MDVVEDLCKPLAGKLWGVHTEVEGGPHLIFPSKRDLATRVSEQESKIMLCQVLEASPWYYSVETPTREKYQQSGTFGLSGRLDLTVYGTRSAADRLLNIELKAGVPPLENFRKDFEKLAREGTDGLWFHTLDSINQGTISAVLTRMGESIRLIDVAARAARHTITIALCVLNQRVLLTARFPFGTDLETHLLNVFESGMTPWTAHGDGAETYLSPKQSRTSSIRPDLRGQDKMLIYCPEVADDTLLHFSQKGNGYKLRAFTGRFSGRSPWVEPNAPTASEFMRIYQPLRKFDVLHERTNLEQKDVWRDIVNRYARHHGVGESHDQL